MKKLVQKLENILINLKIKSNDLLKSVNLHVI